MSLKTLISVCILALLSLVANAAPYVARRGPPSRSFVSPSLGKSDRSFSLTEVKNPKFQPKRISSTEAYAQSFLKHNTPMPDALQTAYDNLKANTTATYLKARDSGTTVASSLGLYVFPIQIGTPAQTMNMLFDTGSGDFWVWSWLMPGYMLSGRNYYNGTQSSSAGRWDGQYYDASYGAGISYGLVWLDTVWVESGRGPFGVAGNPIECSQNVGGQFEQLTGVDGILGLNNAFYDTEQPSAQQTWITYVLPNLAASLFTVTLVYQGTATIDFGYIDSTKYIGQIYYTPVTVIQNAAAGFWAPEISGFQFGNLPFNHTQVQMMTDTGGNIVHFPAAMCAQYYSQVQGSYLQTDGSWAYPCSSNLPNIVIGIGNGRVTLSSKYFTFSRMDNGDCWGAIQPATTSYIYFTVPFLQSVFVVHDYGNMRIGFANRAAY